MGVVFRSSPASVATVSTRTIRWRSWASIGWLFLIDDVEADRLGLALQFAGTDQMGDVDVGSSERPATDRADGACANGQSIHTATAPSWTKHRGSRVCPPSTSDGFSTGQSDRNADNVFGMVFRASMAGRRSYASVPAVTWVSCTGRRSTDEWAAEAMSRKGIRNTPGLRASHALRVLVTRPRLHWPRRRRLPGVREAGFHVCDIHIGLDLTSMLSGASDTRAGL